MNHNIAPYEQENKAVKYTPHFFMRYKERMMKVCDWRLKNQLASADTLKKIVVVYMQRNLGTAWVETESVYKDKIHIFAPVPDGVSLLQWDDKHKVMQANTFITYDMLGEKQNGMVQMLKDYIKLNTEERKTIDSLLFEGK